MNLEDRAKQFIFLKQKWKDAVGTANRYQLKQAYQIFEADLVIDLPQNYRIDGLVLVKGFARLKNADYPYIAIFTDQSFQRRNQYSKGIQ